MMAEIQAMQLVLAFALGAALGLFYDIYRVWFRAPGRRCIKGLGDILWWLAALLLAAVGLYYINGLALRGFTLALAAAGCLLEQLLITPGFFPLISRVSRWLVHLAGGVCRLLYRLAELVLLPLSYAAELLFRLLLLLWAVVRRLAYLLRRFGLLLVRPFWLAYARIKKRYKVWQAKKAAQIAAKTPDDA